MAFSPGSMPASAPPPPPSLSAAAAQCVARVVSMFNDAAGSLPQVQSLQWCTSFQDAPEAWAVCIEILQSHAAACRTDAAVRASPNVAALNYAAQVLHNKAATQWKTCPASVQHAVLKVSRTTPALMRVCLTRWCRLQGVHDLVAGEMSAPLFPAVVTRRLCLLACRLAYHCADTTTAKPEMPMLHALLALQPDPASVPCVTTYLELCKAFPQELDDLSSIDARGPVSDVLAPTRARFLSIVKHVHSADSRCGVAIYGDEIVWTPTPTCCCVYACSLDAGFRRRARCLHSMRWMRGLHALACSPMPLQSASRWRCLLSSAFAPCVLCGVGVHVWPTFACAYVVWLVVQRHLHVLGERLAVSVRGHH